MVLAVPSASAQGGSLAISGNLSPGTVVSGKSVHISLNITNNLGKDIDGYDVQIFVYKSSMSATPDTTRELMAADGMTTPIVYDWPSKGEGVYTVVVVILDDGGNQVGDPYELSQKIHVDPKVNNNESFLDMKIAGIPIIFILVIVVFLVAIIAVVAVKMRNKKKKGPEITGEGVEVQGRVAWGKMPENYYKERRDRLSKLRPVGLTRDGRTIMGNSAVGDRGVVATVEVDHSTDVATSKTCPKCGFEMEANWKSCLKCEAISNIKETKTMMKNPFFQGHNLDFAEVVVRQADAAFEAENYTEASVFALDARTKVEDYKRKVEAERKGGDEIPKGGPGSPVEPKPGTVAKPTLKPPASCTGCGMGMQEDWTKCPVCGMTVEDMLKPQSDKPVENPIEVQAPIVQVPKTYTCSTCGNEKENETAACIHCNTGRAISNAERKVKELRLTISSIKLTSEDQLEVNEAFDLFADAKGAFTDKDYNTAVGLAGETIEMVDDLLSRFKPPAPAPQVPKPQVQQAPPKPLTPAAPTVVQTTMAIADNKCPKCGMSVKPTWEICPQCDTHLRAPTPATAAQKTCPKCGKPVKDRWTICPFCESPLK